MNTYTITHQRRISPGIIAALVAGAMIIGAAALIARADTPPTITQAIRNGSNATITTAPIGTAVHNVVTIASSTSSTTPTGTVNFNRYDNMTCSGTPTTQTGVALVLGVAQSATTTVSASGFSYNVHYSGDASTTVADSGCQSLTATAASVSITTSLSTSTVLAGSSVYDTATLNNETPNATGTVSYRVYNNNLCTTGVQSAGVKTVTNGVVPNSDTLAFNTAGTYYWQAVYSGDQYNSSATSSCQSGLLQVVATTTATSTRGIIRHDRERERDDDRRMSTSTHNRTHRGDNDDDDTATSTDKGGHGLGRLINDFIKGRFSNGHDNGNHFGQFKNGNNGKHKGTEIDD